MSNNSDYRKPRIEIDQLLPDVVKTNVISSFLNNGGNRLFTADDTVYVEGTIGKKNTRFLSDTRIIENDVHRQAWQLQPILHSKIATEDKVLSYKDILNKLDQLGVDITRLPKWGDTTFCNYAPPVDIDKLINFQNYYWVGGTKPQYITIKNKATIIRSQIIELTKIYNQLLIDNNDPVRIENIKNSIQALFNEEQQLSANNLGWSSTLWDDNLGEWDTDQLWNSLQVTQPSGLHTWDSEQRLNKLNDWQIQNKWIHKSDVVNANQAVQATMPIIEYLDTVELNEWVYTKHKWKYRKHNTDPWVSVTSEPSIIELHGFLNISTISVDTNLSSTPIGETVFVLKSNLVDSFIPGTQFNVERTQCNDGVWSVKKVEFNDVLNVTLVYTNDVIQHEAPRSTIFDDDLYGFDVLPTDEWLATCAEPNKTPDGYGIITPVTTSIGDNWKGLYTHWKWDGVEDAVPVNNQTPNNSQTSYVFITQTAQTRITLPFSYFVNIDNLQVYINGTRQYGTYYEVLKQGLMSDEIIFNTPIPAGSYILVRTGPACSVDVGREMAWVRTSEIQTDDVSSVLDYVCLLRYRKREQVKQFHTQYPVFNIFNIDGTTSYTANSIFVFTEDNTYPIDVRVDNRIKITNKSEFYFTNYLKDGDALLCYKDIELNALQTIWKQGAVSYTPRYVNEYQLADGDVYTDNNSNTHIASVPLLSSAGDWEIPAQLYYNTNHENRSSITYTQLFTHFKSVIDNQPVSSDYIDVPVENRFKLLTTIDYSVGGTIREYNGSYDTFLSSIYQDNITPTNVITFARDQYLQCLSIIKELYVKYAIDILNQQTVDSILSPTLSIIQYIIELYGTNSNLTSLYSDSTAYNGVYGVKNWIATLPILKIIQPTVPILLNDSKLGINKIVHHDGHMSDAVLSSKDEANMLNILLDTNGSKGVNNFPLLQSIPLGHFWYDTATKQLWRYKVIYIGNTPPSITFSEGTLWYNNITDQLYVRSNAVISGWDVVVNRDIAWQEINLNNIYQELILHIETELYNICALSTPVYNFNDLIDDADDAVVFYKKLNARFLDYAKTYQLDPFMMDYNLADPFTWNYRDIESNLISYPYATDKWGARWYTIYEELFNTQYPHLEPWKLQLFPSKPTWWDTEYKGSNRRWSNTMWYNIKNGIIPSHIDFGDNVLPPIPPTYDRVCVNITDSIIDGYNPDDLLPPYFDGDIVLEAEVLLPGSLVNINDIIDSISLPYNFGDQNINERKWRESISYNYDLLYVGFLMQPIRTLINTFGYQFTNISGLYIEHQTKSVISHKKTYFHGDVVDNALIQVNGLNQWFVNALRYQNSDIITSEFKQQWVGWDTKLTYQFNSSINTRTLNVDTQYYDIIPLDYQVLLKRVPAVDEYWISALIVSLQQVGTKAHNTVGLPTPFSTGDNWVYRIDTPVDVGFPFKSYDVNHYNIISIDINNSIIEIDRAAPWETGTEVQLISNIASIKTNYPYYVITISNTKFKLATSYNDAYVLNDNVVLFDNITFTYNDTSPDYPNHNDVWITSAGELYQYNIISKTWISYSNTNLIINLPPNTNPNDVIITNFGITMVDGVDYVISNNVIGLNVADINSTQLNIIITLNTSSTIFELYTRFTALNSANCPINWYHYTVNNTRTITNTSPLLITGIQNVINFIDGYVAYSKDQGFIFNDLSHTPDIDEETGNIISWQLEIEKLIDKMYRGFNNKYNSVDTLGNDIIRDYIEVNPFKYNIWMNQKRGIISNIISGPYVDIKTHPIVFNQFGKPILSIENLKVYRMDKQTHIMFPHSNVSTDTTNSHIGGLHLYGDIYEHIIMFNNYTTDGYLIYDPYIGVNINKIKVNFRKHFEVSGRPNIGGNILINGDLVENIEGLTQNLRNLYDTYTVDEYSSFVDIARSLVHYNSNDLTFFDSFNISEKSKFIFWKGLIQHKGSNKTLDAFVNSKQYENVMVDEYWAYRVGDFGSTELKIKPQLNVLSSDITKNSLRYEFVTNDVYNSAFTAVYSNDALRWKNLPDLEFIQQSNMIFEADIIPIRDYTIIVYNNRLYSEFDAFFDSITGTFENNINFIQNTTIEYPNNVVTVSSSFVKNSNSLIVTVDGDVTSNYTELDNNQIQISILPNSGVHNITVRFKQGTLVAGKHFNIIKSNVVEWLTDIRLLSKISLFGCLPNNNIHSGVKLLDKLGNEIQDIPLWDPARGFHIPLVQLHTDYIQSNDPARYMYDINDELDISLMYWGGNMIGKIWIDVSNAAYKPYFDVNVLPNYYDRQFNWGKLQDWCSVTAYEWVESDVLPSMWDDVVLFHTNNNLITDGKTGTPLLIYYYRTRITADEDWSEWAQIKNTKITINCYKHIISNNAVNISLDSELIDNTIGILYEDDSYDVIINGSVAKTNKYSVVLDNTMIKSINVLGVTASDQIQIIKYAQYPSDQEIDTANSDNASLIEYKKVYPSNSLTTNVNGVSTTKFYFWVESTTNRRNGNISCADIKNLFTKPSNEFMYYQFIQSNSTSTPFSYRGLVVENIQSQLSDNGYSLLLPYDKTLRDIQNGSKVIEKNRHYIWKLLREKQMERVPQQLWNKITESIIGYSLSNTTQVIPSLYRVLYDSINNTVTQYGFGSDQTLGPAEIIKQTVINKLRDTEFNISPINKERFMESFSFNSPTDIITTMDYIFTSFKSVDINAIFFNVLNEALSYNHELDGIFKTSMVAIHSTQKLIATQDIVDD